MRIEVKDEINIADAARKFVSQMKDNKIFAFYGKMGAGKTTFIKAVCKELGVKENVTSPTFAIINEYRTTNEESLYHFDFYRIKNLEEAYDFGYEDYLYSGNICFIEWPELILSLLPKNVTNVTINANHDGSRTIEID